jgi:hypothetical protein
MKTVAKIIKLFGGLENLRENYIRLEPKGFMRLCIEDIGAGFNEGERLISVAHYYEQNGDAMRDPDMVFVVNHESYEKGLWMPVSFRQDGLGIFQEAVFTNEEGKAMIRPRLVKDLKSFARQWSKNLADQGFYAEAQKRVLRIKGEQAAE